MIPAAAGGLETFGRWLVGEQRVPALDGAMRVVLLLLICWSTSHMIRQELQVRNRRRVHARRVAQLRETQAAPQDVPVPDARREPGS